MRVDSVGWMRRSVMALVGLLAMAVVAVAGPAGQATAAPNTSKLCWTVVENGQLKVYCVDIEVQWPWDKYVECWMCGFGFDWRNDPEIGQELEGAIGQNVVKGVGYLGQAQFTTDAALRDRLRTQALDAFTVAARYNGSSTMTLGAVGVANPERNTFDPSPQPWLTAAGIDLADGVTLLQRSFDDPAGAARLRSMAQAQFDEAYQELSNQRVIGG